MSDRDPKGCNREKAREYLGGIGEKRMERLIARKIVKSLGRDWYAYVDLDEAIEALRRERR